MILPIQVIVKPAGPTACWEAAMTVEPRNTIRELQTLYRTETHARLARRIQAVWLARKGRTCPEIMDITGARAVLVCVWTRLGLKPSANHRNRVYSQGETALGDRPSNMIKPAGWVYRRPKT